MRDEFDATAVLNSVLQWGYQSGTIPGMCQFWKVAVESDDYFQVVFRVRREFLGRTEALVGLHCHRQPGPAGDVDLASVVWMDLDELLGAGDHYRQRTVAADEDGVFWFTQKFTWP